MLWIEIGKIVAALVAALLVYRTAQKTIATNLGIAADGRRTAEDTANARMTHDREEASRARLFERQYDVLVEALSTLHAGIDLVPRIKLITEEKFNDLFAFPTHDQIYAKLVIVTNHKLATAFANCWALVRGACEYKLEIFRLNRRVSEDDNFSPRDEEMLKFYEECHKRDSERGLEKYGDFLRLASELLLESKSNPPA